MITAIFYTIQRNPEPRERLHTRYNPGSISVPKCQQAADLAESHCKNEWALWMQDSCQLYDAISKLGRGPSHITWAQQQLGTHRKSGVATRDLRHVRLGLLCSGGPACCQYCLHCRHSPFQLRSSFCSFPLLRASCILQQHAYCDRRHGQPTRTGSPKRI